MRALSYATALILFIVSSVNAETAHSPKDLRPGSRLYDYLFSHDFDPILIRYARELDNKTGAPCRSKYIVQPEAVSFAEAPLILPENSVHPVRGQWLLNYSATRCNKTSLMSAVFVSQAGNAPKSVPGFPGRTRANLSLQITTYKNAILMADARMEIAGIKCGLIELADTEYVKEEEPTVVNGVEELKSWSEVWTFVKCGYAAQVLVIFDVDPQEGAYVTIQDENVKIRKLN